MRESDNVQEEREGRGNGGTEQMEMEMHNKGGVIERGGRAALACETEIGGS